MIWLKRIGGLAFALAFIMALVLFAGIGVKYIPISIARIIFLMAGAIGLLFNFLSFKYGKHDPNFNFIYWLGSLILFTGLVFMILHWPYGNYILIAGMLTVGLSFFVQPDWFNSKINNEDILDH
jgi:hypothetical protein